MSALDKKKTFTSMQFVPLLEPDISIRAAKKQLMWTSETMQNYNVGYWTWKHEYRTRYSEKFLEKYGFTPESDSSIIVFDDSAVLAYVKAEDPLALKVSDASVQFVSPDVELRFQLQLGTDPWSNKSSILTVGAIEYELTEVSYLENDDPFLPDDQTKIIGTFVNIIDDEDIYVMEIENNSLNINTMSVFYFHVLNPTDDDEWYIYLEEFATVPNSLFTNEDMVLTPIVALKEDNIIIGESLETKKMMNKLNVDGDDFQEMLENEDIDNAYLLQGLPLKNPYEIRVGFYTTTEAEALPTQLIQKMIKYGETNLPGGVSYNVTQELADEWYNDHLREQAYIARALFKSFAYYGGLITPGCTMPKMSYVGDCVDDMSCTDDNPFDIFGCKTVSFTDSALQMAYTFNISVKTHEGTVRGSGITDRRSQGDLHFSGKVITVKDDEGDRSEYHTSDSEGYDKLVIKVQKNETQYQEMIITGYNNTFMISGRTFDNTLGSPQQEHRLLLPYFVTQDIRFVEYVTIYEHSFIVLAYAIEVVTIKWYKRFAGVFIAFALGIFTGGALIPALINLAIGMVVTVVVENIMEMIDSEILQFLVQVGIMLISAGMNGFDFTQLTAENYLRLADQVSSLALNSYSAHVAKEKALEERAKEREEQSEENITDKMENLESAMTVFPKADMGAHYSSTELNSPEALYSELLGDNLYNFEQFFNIDIQIETRKQVVTG